MKLKNIFEEEIINDSTVMVSLDNTILNGIIHANETASFIISNLKEDTSIDAIASKLSLRYNISLAHAVSSVEGIVFQLRELHLIEE